MAKRGDKENKSSPGRETTNQSNTTDTQKKADIMPAKQKTGTHTTEEQNNPDHDRRRSLGWENK